MSSPRQSWKVIGTGLLVFGYSYGCGQPRRGPVVTRTDSAGVEVLSFSSARRLEDTARWLPLVKTRAIPTTPEDAAGRPLVFDPRSMLLTQNGDLIVTDMAGPPIVVVPPAGSSAPYRFASIGQGPGELWGGIPLLWTQDDSLLAVADRGNERVTVFDMEGNVRSETNVPPHFGFMLDWQVDPASGDLVALISGASADTSVADSLIALKPPYTHWSAVTALARHRTSRLGKPTMWLPRVLWAVLPGGRIVIGSTNSGVLKVLDMDGHLLRELRLPLSPRPVSEEDRRLVSVADSHSTSKPAGHWEFPDVMPVTDELLAFDDSTVAMRQTWVSNPEGPHAVGQRSMAWRLISMNGSLPGIVMFDPGFQPRWTDGKRVVGVQRDSLDVAILVEYLIGTTPRDRSSG